MLSKQDKLKYGEQLRRQMREREQKKKSQQLQKRGLKKSPTDPRLPIDSQPHQYPYQDNKQILQNRQQSQNVQYFGRPGGGAPNRIPNQQNFGGVQPSYNNYQQNQYGRVKTTQEYGGYQNQQQGFGYLQQQPQQLQKIGSQFQNYRGNLDNPYGKNLGANYQQYDQALNFVQQQQQAYNMNNSGPYAPPSYANPNIPQNIPQQYNPRVPTDRSLIDPHLQYQAKQYPGVYPNYPQQRFQAQPQVQPQYNLPLPQTDLYQQPIQQINQKHEAYRQKTLQNEQLMQIHKKGGRNLLQLENMTIDQQQIKQKQKEEMRKQLELQMKEAQERKKEELERIKREELEEQRKNIQYLEKKNRELEEEERQKVEKQRAIQQRNARDFEQRRRLQQQAKQKALRQKMKQSNAPATNQNSPKVKQKQVFSRQAQFQADQTTSQVSSSTVMQKAFNTGVSKQFFQNQRKKDQQRYNREKNLQAVTEEIKRLKEHIDKQNQFFKREIQKVKLESQMAESQKKKAEQEIQNLKMQLKKKMEDDNQRLFMALQRQERLENEEEDMRAQHRNERKQPQRGYNQNVEVLKPSQNEKFVKKKYEAPQQQSKKSPVYNANLAQSNISEDGMLISLHGDSKKIPINLPDEKLSMSQLSDFARETKFFKNQGKSPYLGSNNKKYSMQAQESIAEQDEERAESRAAGRKQPAKNHHQKDELDRLVQKRQKSRDGNNWGELSSVNSDITKQIQELLKKKDNPYRPPSSTKYDNQNNLYPQYNPNKNTNQRPSSHLSNAGKRALSRNGLDYEGASLGTINSNVGGNGTLGTVDIDRIQNRNDKRLKELRNLGVETINTNGDEEFSQLDMILNKYKQSMVQ